MVFSPKHLIATEGQFVFSGDLLACAHPCLRADVIAEFWHNFTFGASDLKTDPCEEYVFSVGDAEPLPLDGYAYSIRITPSGVCVFAESERDLIHGYMTLLDRIHASDRQGDERLAVEIACAEIRDRASIANRMVHFCIFPETELWELQRFLRLCGALKYTHVVLEFWGMLQYDCMRELAWSHGFSKEQVRPIIEEARALGLEIIPMFNHWGHASAGRVMHGKHVVLDQNPALQSYFNEDGWCWDIAKPKVRDLLRQLRRELIELCGEGSYFHIGCDEAYTFRFNEENVQALCEFLNEISAELQAVGRRAIMWGDMLLYRHAHYNPKNRYTCNAPSAELESEFLARLDRRIVIADWQYRAPEAPVETCAVFREAGFDCIFCPWDEGKPQIDAALETVGEQSLMGFMHTTWHTLSSGMPYVTAMAVGGFAWHEGYKAVLPYPLTAALLRRVMPIHGDYAKAGWSRFEISSRW